MVEQTIDDRLAEDWTDLLARLPEPDVPRPHGARRPLRAPAVYAELEDLRLLVAELRADPRLEAGAERYLNASWTLKDLMAHLASWVAETRREAETAARGDRFDYAIPYALSVIGPNEWNAVEVEKRRPESLAGILAEYDGEVEQLQDLVLGLPDEALNRPQPFPLAPSGDPAALWTGTVGQIVVAQTMHQRYHLGQVQRWLARQ
jgi:hypothetical protein